MRTTGCDEKNLEPMAGSVSWIYNYGQRVSMPGKSLPGVLKWVNDNEIEFVPMLAFRYLILKDGTKCYFANRAQLDHIPDSSNEDNIEKIRDLANCSKTRCCEDSEIWELFDQLIDEMKVKPKYLMGFNEPYCTKPGMDHKNIPALEAADYIRTVLLPIADRYNFELVSPTTGPETNEADDPDDGISKSKMGWIADMLVACWKMRKANPPCLIDRITKFSLHKYTCKGDYWERMYGDTETPGGTFNRILIDMLEQRTPHKKGWPAYVNGLKYWVTETNCNWDGSKNNGPSPKKQCRHITGQTNGGIGSLKTFEKLDKIERYLWWNLYNGRDRQMTQVARMTNIDGSLTPIGRAYTNDLSETTDCNDMGNTFKFARFEEQSECSGGTLVELGKIAEKGPDDCLEECMKNGKGLANWCCNFLEFSGKCQFVTGNFELEPQTSKLKFAAVYPPRDFNSIDWR